MLESRLSHDFNNMGETQVEWHLKQIPSTTKNINDILLDKVHASFLNNSNILGSPPSEGLACRSGK